MIDRDHGLSLGRQAKALGISRGSVYYLARPTSDADLALMRRIDELHLEHPFAGSRMLRDMLGAEGRKVGCGFRSNRPGIPISSRPPFRNEAGHRSDQ